ncbi:FAD-binding protein [Roseibium polysiphoniae]|uniref:FAD-binding protein n=1 Tax=Roseibium polysiphoniae TaxID=2571221 RepID=A0ABR9CBX8_9HYPH|nr:FAD-binding protein [Roseibium polysiphoniae]MBD8876590.1 FAD-binding protein [Roseibium polysiphoniae]
MTTTEQQSGPTRRAFMAMGGSAAGMAALGVNAGWGQNTSVSDASAFTTATHDCDVLVIGGGMAGLFAAVKGHDAGAKIRIVSKGRLGSSGLTPFAKGFFAFDPAQEELTLDEYVAAVSRSALGTNNPVYTRQTAEHSLARVEELKAWGFFDSNLYNKSFMTPIEARGIPLHERVVVTHLLKDGERIAGAAGFRLDAEEVVIFRAKSVVLCTGAGAFKPNGFPVCDLTHDGTVMAYNIGAKVTGKEWNDGHVGRAKNPAATYDGWGDMFDRRPSLEGVGIRHDLGVDANYLAYKLGNPVEAGPGSGPGKNVAGGPFRPVEFADNGPPPGPPEAAGMGDGPPAGGGPGIGGGPPGMRGPAMGGASAGMSIHKSEGLVPINDRCESNIPGLFAAGDALGSHMCGAIYTQIGSSLAGSAVQGAVGGEAAADYARDVETPILEETELAAVEEEILAPLRRKAGYGPAWVTQTLQGIMIPNFVLYIKKESILSAALAYIEELRDHHSPMLRAADMHELRLAHETSNMIISAEMKLRASLMRKESRCSHYRLDYPDVDDENWRAWINIYKDESGDMRLEKQPFDTWPAQT